MAFLMISCKKATYLLSKKEENRLSWREKLQLRGHLTICSFCRKFEEQTGWMILNTKHLHEHSGIRLSVEARERIANSLK
jgi:hypothetical protein